LEISYYNPTELIAAEYNPRQLTKDQHKDLTDSIKRFGLVDPLIVNTHKERKNILVGGHQRLKIAQELNIKEIPCVEVELNPDQEKELNIRLNKNSGEWDYDALANYFDVGELTEWGFTDDELQFYEDEPEQGLIDDDEIPEVEESITKQGYLWLLGEHRLLCGDATKKEDVERLMDGQKAELLFTSPPYSDMRDYGGNDLSIETLIKFIPAFYPLVECQVINLGIQRKNHEIVEYWQEYINQAKGCGYKFLSWNVWSRRGMGGSIANMSAMFRMEHEWIFVFGKQKKELNNTQKNISAGLHTGITNRQKDGTTKRAKPKTVKEYGRLSSVLEMCYGNSVEHPATYPVELPFEYISAMTKKTEFVIDPFLGSGSTLIACEKTNRKCYGMEIDPHYCDVIVKRWEEFTGNKAERVEAASA